MTDCLPITPITRQLDATVKLPGSKSITNRALILAALSDGNTALEGALFSRDTQIMVRALEKLGFECRLEPDQGRLTVRGNGGSIPEKSAHIDVGNAGTAARFLTAFLALEKGGTYHLDGDPAMRTRPMAGLLNALTALDAAAFSFHGEPGHFPFTLKAKGYKGGISHVDASASSQILSALLLAAPAGKSLLELNAPGVRPAYIRITQKIREAFGAPPLAPNNTGRYELNPVHYISPGQGSYQIEPDLSAASYFLALALIHGGHLELPGLSPQPLQGDAKFAETLTDHGLYIDAQQNKWVIQRSGSQLIKCEKREIDFNAYSDTFLTYAAIAPLLGGSVRLFGIGHTRHQETDRIAGMAKELSKLGQEVVEEEEALTIRPALEAMRALAIEGQNSGQILEVETYEDHRFAMSFAVLGSYDLTGNGKPWLAIKDPACCGKTFPNFFEILHTLDHA